MPVFGSDQDDDIDAWMAQRNQDVADRDQNAAAGQAAWAASTATGDNLQAPNPADVTALGADSQGQDAAAKSTPSPEQIGAIVWNETRSLSGPQVQQMREGIAHTVLNADAKWGDRRMTYAHSAPMTARVPDTEQGTFQASLQAANKAVAEHSKGIDPTSGAVFYQFLPGPSPKDFQNRSMKLQQGPFNNSYPKGILGPNNVHWYAY